MLMNLPEILKGQKRWKARKFKPVKTSKRTERWYSDELKKLVKSMRSDVESALQAPQGAFFMDDAQGFQAISTQALLNALKKYAKTDRTFDDERIAQGFVNRGNVQNQAEVATNLKNQTGIDLAAYLRSSPNIAEKVNAMTTANIQLISSIRSQYLDKVQNAVTQAMIKGSLNKDLAQQIKDIGKVTEKRAAFIARDQSAKLNASLTQARHEDVGITKYTWSTSGDERVRDSHAEKDGQVFEYANPPADTGNPGRDFNCRCVAIPFLGDILEQKPKEVEQDQENEQETQKELPKDLPDVINVGKSIADKYQDVIDKAIANGTPHEGIMEIMRREGVEMGGQVKVASLEKRAVAEASEMVKRYPKNWVEAANSASNLVIKEYKARAFQMKVPDNWDIERLKSGRVKWGRYKPLASSIEKGLLKNGDTFILSNTNHGESMRLSRYIHEYGHKLQREIPELDKYFSDLWKRRTAGKPYIKYNGEQIKDGGFPHPYYGRDYGDEKNPKPYEMLTMTFEALLGHDPENTLDNLRKKDPELFNLGLALLTRYKL